MDQAPPSRSSWLVALLVLLALGGSAVGVLLYQASQSKEKPAVDKSGFDLAEGPRAPALAGAGTAQPAAAGSDRMSVSIGRMPGTQPGGPAVSDEERQRELEFIRRYGGIIKEYQERLEKITDKYRERYAVVKEVDLEFGKLPRYMAIRARYEEDRDGYQFARDVVALPEVRKLIVRYLANAEAWKASLGMISEAIREPPPKPVLDEMKRFFTHDKSMTSYVTEFGQEAATKVPLMAQNIPPNTDMQEIGRLAQEIAPKAALPAGAAPAPRRR